MKKIIFLSLFCISVSLTYSQPGQSVNSDSVFTEISYRVNLIAEKLIAMENSLKAIDNNTNLTGSEEIKENKNISLVNEILGYGIETGINLILKLISVILFLILIVKIVLYYHKAEKYLLLKYVFRNFSGVLFVPLIFLSLLLPWTSVVFPDDEAEKTQLIRVNSKIERIRNDVDSLKSVNVIELIQGMEDANKSGVDSILLTSEKGFLKLASRMDTITGQFVQLNAHIDSLNNLVNKYASQNFVKKEQQNIQLLIMGGIIILLIIFIFLVTSQLLKILRAKA